MPGRSTKQDPLKTFDFVAEIDGFKRIGFHEVTGLEVSNTIIEYREGGTNHTAQKSLGLATYPNVVFKRGQVIDPEGEGEDDCYIWQQQCNSVRTFGWGDNDPRRGITIVQYHRDGTEARRWRIVNCLVARYKPLGDLGGQTENNSIEELEVAHEGFDREGGPDPAGRGQSLSPSLGIGS